MLISVELYTQLIEQKSYAAGRVAELEKQLEKLNILLADSKKYYDKKLYRGTEESTCPPIEIIQSDY